MVRPVIVEVENGIFILKDYYSRIAERGGSFEEAFENLMEALVSFYNDFDLGYIVFCERDEVSGLWTARSDDLEGLYLEEESFSTLVSEIEDAGPDLLALNGLM